MLLSRLRRSIGAIHLIDGIPSPPHFGGHERTLSAHKVVNLAIYSHKIVLICQIFVAHLSSHSQGLACDRVVG